MAPPDVSLESPALRVAYLGPAGTNTHAAALAFFGDSASYLPEATIRSVFDAVTSRTADRGVVPIENSTEGAVGPTLDALFDLDVQISGEYVADISHCLVARPGTTLASVERVLSHPQALAQCRRWFLDNIPGATLVPAASTAAAAVDASRITGAAAVSSRLAAELNGLEILREGIEDLHHNATRFVAIGPTDAPPTGRDRTSLVFTTKHERGALRRALQALDDHGLNLTRIESRPLLSRRWEYAFFTDLEGSRHDDAVRQGILDLQGACGFVKVLGSYPRVV